MSKLSISKEGLSKALSFLQTGIPTKELIGTDGVFQFTVTDDSCTVKIVNAKVQMSAWMKCESKESFSFCVPNYIMQEMVRNFPDGNIIINTVNDGDEVKAINLSPEGQRKRYKIACMHNSSFPNFTSDPKEEDVLCSLNIPAGIFTQTLKTTASNVDASDTRPCFTDIVLIPIDGKLTFVSGNPFLICFLKTDIDFEKSFIIRRQIAQYISTFTANDMCNIKITSQSIFITYGGHKIQTAMCDGQIPNYKAYLDMEPKNSKAIIAHKEFYNTINRLVPFSDDFQRIDIKVKENELQVSAVNSAYGNEADEIIPVENDSNMEIHIGVKHAYIKKMMQNISSENIELRHKDSLIFIRPEATNDTLWMIALLST